MKDVFKVVTRGNVSARGKARVFFACHHDDFKYFDEVSKDILDIVDVAVYYNDDFSEIDHIDEYKFNLSQMSLVVIPISSKFLTEKSRAYDIELRHARENNIPVLLILFENGLDELFAKKCGHLQYLNKFNSDQTAISYTKKLADFLNTVLIDNELAEKIRSSFDAYVFLSYRKKDRIFAQEFMKRVHSNDALRDIAIWYDEFLTPGENFNDEIKEALKKSKLFALLVTPSLIEPNNYVMNIEYPMAQKEGKTILPAEAVRTDHNEMKAFYKELPEIIDGQNKVVLTEQMLKALKRLAITKNDNPEHTYYIALAYLNGIDVELDRQKAVELLTESAEAGEEKAIRKLANMYKVGDSVPVDWNKEYSYLAKLFESHMQSLSKAGFLEVRKGDMDFVITDSNIKEFGEFAELLDDFADVNKRLGEYKRIESLYQTMLKLYKELARLQPKKFLKNINLCYNSLGILFYDYKDYDKAENNFLKSFTITKELAKKGDVDLASLCTAYNNIASCKMLKGDYKGAEDYLQKGLVLNIKYYEQSKSYDALQSLANKNKSLGSVYQFLRDLDKAIKYYKEAIALYKKLVVTREYFLGDLADAMQKLALVYSVAQNFKEAEKVYDQSFAITNLLCKRNPKAFLSKHADGFLAKSSLYKNQGDLKKAKDMCEKARTIYQALAKNNPKVYTQYVEICDQVLAFLKQ